MTRLKRRRSDRSGRAPLPSPGRPLRGSAFHQWLATEVRPLSGGELTVGGKCVHHSRAPGKYARVGKPLHASDAITRVLAKQMQ